MRRTAAPDGLRQHRASAGISGLVRKILVNDIGLTEREALELLQVATVYDMRSTAFTVHKDVGDEGVVWWAESDQVPGFSAAADTLDDLCRLISEAVSLRGGSGSAFSLEFPAATDMPARTGPDRAADHRD